MTSSEQRIGEAVASLTARLTSWAVEEPMVKAHEFIRDMLDNGWRPTGAYRDKEPPRGKPASEEKVAEAVALARAGIDAAKGWADEP